MKTKLLIALFCLILSGVLFPACKKSEEQAKPGLAAILMSGKWTVTKHSISPGVKFIPNGPVVTDLKIQFQNEIRIFGDYIFNKDGRVYYTVYTKSLVRWEVSDDNKALTFRNDDNTVSRAWEVTGYTDTQVNLQRNAVYTDADTKQEVMQKEMQTLSKY
jgi:hypothetical protein